MADDNDEDYEVFSLKTPDEMLAEGLLLAGFPETQLERWSWPTKMQEFRDRYGSKPIVLCQIWEDLQSSPIDEARVAKKKLKLKYFLMAHHFLKRYPTESERHCAYHSRKQTQRDWVWFFVRKMAALAKAKIYWPADHETGDDIWICTVDGTMTRAYEKSHPEVAKDPDMFDFKHRSAGYNSEIVLSIIRSQCLQFRATEKAGEWSDRVHFRAAGGLRDKLRSIGKKGIADGGYTGDSNELSTPNGHDTASVRRFKTRALKRHENFNSKIKNFRCLSDEHRHKQSKLKLCFAAVVVICQYQMDLGEPLWNIYAGEF